MAHGNDIPAANQLNMRLRNNQMAETNGSDNIDILLEKRGERQRVFEQTLELVDKAGEKHREDRQNRRKWNRILIRLEDSVVEVKKAVAECDTLIQIERRKAEETVEEPDESRASTQAEAEPSVVEPDLEKRAAYKIAQAPIEELAHISLQDAAFARAYTARRAFGTHDKKFRKKLSTKLELASQLPRVPHTHPGQGEKRSQDVLRNAIARVQEGQIESMSDQEIDLVVGCYTILTGMLVPNANNNRLLETISGMIEALRAERPRRRLSSR